MMFESDLKKRKRRETRSVVHVKNAVEAEKEIKNRFFDVILLDIMIDGKPEGISLAHRLNKQHIEVPFLFLTSNTPPL